MLGWVYIFTNKAMPGLVKVGYTTKCPKERAQRLNHSGVPYPYVVEYAVQVEEPHSFEQQVHRNLADCRAGKEWFRCSVAHAAAAIDKKIPPDCPTLAYSEKTYTNTTKEPRPLAEIEAAAQDSAALTELSDEDLRTLTTAVKSRVQAALTEGRRDDPAIVQAAGLLSRLASEIRARRTERRVHIKEATPEAEPLLAPGKQPRTVASRPTQDHSQVSLSPHEIIIVSVLMGLFIYGLSLVLLSTIFGDVWSMSTLYIVCLVPSVSGGMWTMKMYASRALTA